MKATELRVGNLVTGSSDTLSRVATVGVSEIEYAHLFDPIPITEYGLKKFGFEYWDDMKLYQKDGFGFKKGDYHSMAIEMGVVWIPCKYVHQLQNLYFALRGEELTIEELKEKV